MDRGMVSEDNIEFMRKRGARYIVAHRSPCSGSSNKTLQRGGEVHPAEVKKCASPEGAEEVFVTLPL